MKKKFKFKLKTGKTFKDLQLEGRRPRFSIFKEIIQKNKKYVLPK